ncbi:MAG: UDP-N-acetylmuramoyl-tripeptide--D-alanyl-D-alanine ligase [Chlamydiae bacterium]|nr:UDP-N-acetylmuramoyl-tripeptide--D-alanyl-D-alanine ligase [Chlamydiota bacterium]
MWNLKEIALVLGCQTERNDQIGQFAIDSRLVEKGGIFFALPGEKVDGHQFLQEIAAKGGVAAIVREDYAGPDFGLALLRVRDVKKSLQTLAKKAFSRRREKVVAITGSMGKTTTKEFVTTLLETKYRVAKTPGNYNTQLTLPLTILNLEGEYDVLVLEMGMGDTGQIAQLVQIAPPDIALVTRIAPAGMEDFRGGLEAIAKAKAEIFSHHKTTLGIMSAQAAGFGAVYYGGGIPKWIYGWKEDLFDGREADFVMEEKAEGVVINDSPPISLGFEGKHLKENFLGAVALARAMNLSWKEIQDQATKCRPYKRRFEKIEREGITFIQDCYNANPESVSAALLNLPRPAKEGKVIGVLGTMPDLGKASSHYHKEVGTFAANVLDRLLCIGKEANGIAESFSQSGKEAEHFTDVAAVREKLFALAKPGDVVLIKGANSLKLWEILEG